MWAPVGRPRSACTACKRQKVCPDMASSSTEICMIEHLTEHRQIRCSGDRPICKRCSRLKRTCLYSDDSNAVRPSTHVSSSAASAGPSSSSLARAREERPRTSGEGLPVGHCPCFATAILFYSESSKGLIRCELEVYRFWGAIPWNFEVPNVHTRRSVL
jgi:hypothetical protein